MGQRSQIYIRIQHQKDSAVKHDELIARYFQWNYSERMISRAASTLGWLKHHFNYLEFEMATIPRIVEVNFDMRDIVISTNILKEYREFGKSPYAESIDENNFIFFGQDNNDGKLLIDVLPDGMLKYAFLNDECRAEEQKDVMSPSEYLDWDMEDWRTYLDEDEIAYTEANVSDISEIAEKMTVEEVQEFISADYSFSINKN